MTRERYESLALQNLREIAKNRGMKKISALKKAELIDALLKKDEEDAQQLAAQNGGRAPFGITERRPHSQNGAEETGRADHPQKRVRQ